MAHGDDLPKALLEYLRKDPELSLTRRMAVYRVGVIAQSDGRRVAEVRQP